MQKGNQKKERKLEGKTLSWLRCQKMANESPLGQHVVGLVIEWGIRYKSYLDVRESKISKQDLIIEISFQIVYANMFIKTLKKKRIFTNNLYLYAEN